MPKPRPSRAPAREISPGDEIVNPALYIRAVVLDWSPEILRTEVEAGKGANGGPLHRHLRQEERFIVREGTIKVRKGCPECPRVRDVVDSGDARGYVGLRAERPLVQIQSPRYSIEASPQMTG